MQLQLEEKGQAGLKGARFQLKRCSHETLKSSLSNPAQTECMPTSGQEASKGRELSADHSLEKQYDQVELEVSGDHHPITTATRRLTVGRRAQTTAVGKGRGANISHSDLWKCTPCRSHFPTSGDEAKRFPTLIVTKSVHRLMHIILLT